MARDVFDVVRGVLLLAAPCLWVARRSGGGIGCGRVVGRSYRVVRGTASSYVRVGVERRDRSASGAAARRGLLVARSSVWLRGSGVHDSGYEEVLGSCRSTGCGSVAASSTVLGDWYTNVLFWRPQVALFVDASSFVPVLMPLAPSAVWSTGSPLRCPGVLAGARDRPSVRCDGVERGWRRPCWRRRRVARFSV